MKIHTLALLATPLVLGTPTKPPKAQNTNVYNFPEKGRGFVCTIFVNNRGYSAYQPTKDCCAAVGGKGTYFNEMEDICMAKLGYFVSKVNHRAMAECCKSRGCGARPQMSNMFTNRFSDAFAYIPKHEVDDYPEFYGGCA